MDLSSKLKSLGVTKGSSQSAAKPPRRGPPVDQVMNGEVWDTPHGEAFVVVRRFPTHHKMGSTPLWWDKSLNILAAWAKEPRISNLSHGDFTFLDTETSGLGGVGTYTFMIGAGRFIDDEFVLAQFFLREPGEEPAQLAAFEQFLAPTKALVSFNGKSFDVPMLNNRFQTHNWPSPVANMYQVDLLHLARKLWRIRLPSRRLGDLEVDILGMQRTGEDIPGWLVPKYYLDYLRYGDARPLTGIFYHNEIDILSMASLLTHITDLLHEPLFAVEEDLDLFSIARIHEDLDNLETAIDLYDACLDRSLPEETRLETIQRLSFIHKRRNDLDKAITHWETAAESRAIYAYEELAKTYEHTLKDLDKAIYWTTQALEVIQNPSFPRVEKLLWEDSLAHRLSRLIRKNSSS